MQQLLQRPRGSQTRDTSCAASSKRCVHLSCPRHSRVRSADCDVTRDRDTVIPRPQGTVCHICFSRTKFETVRPSSSSGEEREKVHKGTTQSMTSCQKWVGLVARRRIITCDVRRGISPWKICLIFLSLCCSGLFQNLK